MRLILEKAEIVAVLSKHFDAELDPENVVIRTDPFEIEVCGLPLGTSEAPQKREEPPSNVARLPSRNKDETRDLARHTAVADRADPDATEEPPEPGVDGTEPGTGDVHPAAVLAASKELERQLERENPQLSKKRSGDYSLTPPPYGEDG